MFCHVPYRKLKNIAIKELAEKVQIHPRTISAVEKDETFLNLLTLKKILVAIDLQIDKLVDDYAKFVL